MNFKHTCIAVAALLVAHAGYGQTRSDVAAEMKQLRDELRQLRLEMQALKAQQNVKTEPTPVAAVTAPPTPVVSVPAASPVMSQEAAPSAVSLFGYGELNMTRPRHNASETVATARRGVLGFGYRFNDRTRFAAELEIENAVVSAGDQGEVAFEQLYVEHDIHEHLSAKMGLFLLPIGYMNETHEPTRYMGVHRNLVETAIIPTTWREMGLGLRGTSDTGLRWDAGVVTSFDLTKWPANSAADSVQTKESPLGAIHQEGQLAKAASLAYYGVLNYDGIPGFNIGGSLYQGGIAQKQTIASPNASVTLAEVHTKWQIGSWDLAALAAQGRFHDVSAFNASASGLNNPVPDQFRGWYAQAAYRLWRQGDYSLVPFARYERVNTALSFSGLPVGLAPAVDPDTRVWTMGASFYLHPQVVLKLDTQRYLNNSTLDRLNLGLGFHY
jgi:hypothetical protein